MKKLKNFYQLSLAATLGGLSSMIIAGIIFYIIVVLSTPGPLWQRGSGRYDQHQQIATDDDETPPPQRQRTEIAVEETQENQPTETRN